jgi:hypothetical protein
MKIMEMKKKKKKERFNRKIDKEGRINERKKGIKMK